MARAKHAVAGRKRHKRILKQAKGAWGRRSKHFRRAKETVRRGMVFATRDRKARKRVFRRLWITRIHAACRAEGILYSRFIAGLKTANVTLDRKIMAELAVSDGTSFKELVKIAKEAGQKSAA